MSEQNPLTIIEQARAARRHYAVLAENARVPYNAVIMKAIDLWEKTELERERVAAYERAEREYEQRRQTYAGVFEQ